MWQNVILNYKVSIHFADYVIHVTNSCTIHRGILKHWIPRNHLCNLNPINNSRILPLELLFQQERRWRRKKTEKVLLRDQTRCRAVAPTGSNYSASSHRVYTAPINKIKWTAKNNIIKENNKLISLRFFFHFFYFTPIINIISFSSFICVDNIF